MTSQQHQTGRTGITKSRGGVPSVQLISDKMKTISKTNLAHWIRNLNWPVKTKRAFHKIRMNNLLGRFSHSSVLWSRQVIKNVRCFTLTPFQNAQTQSQSEPLTLSTEKDGIRIVTLNNPRKRNALSLAMLQNLHDELKRDQQNLRVIILKAKGHVFSSGHDLKELTPETGRDYHEEVFSTCTTVMNLIQDLEVSVIAQVNGLATAAGCQLVATCDIAVASNSSQFATPGVNVGLFCTTPGVAVGRSVPRKVAMEMLFTGEPISAQDALLHGLVSKVVPEEDVESETMRIAQKICETSKQVTALGKASFYAQMSLERRNAYRLSEKIMVENLSLDDGIEGISAFVEKRKPVWKKD